MAELVDAPDLGSGIFMMWKFESSHPHQQVELITAHRFYLIDFERFNLFPKIWPYEVVRSNLRSSLADYSAEIDRVFGKKNMRALHIRQKGKWWHYFRTIPVRFQAVEHRSCISFSLKTTCFNEAKLKAAQITYDLEQKWHGGLRPREEAYHSRYEYSFAT